jgi:uncharacterized protein
MNGSKVVSAVIDTNLVVSSFLSGRGLPRALRIALYRGAFRPVLSPPLRDEYAEVLARPRLALDPREVAAFLRFLDRRAQRVVPVTPHPIATRDPKDDMVIATALDGNADYLVSGDNDLLSLAGDPRLGALRIVTVRVFLDALADEPAL